MPLETANYIHQFDASIPADTDPVSETSAILRQVKQVLQTQFPNLGNAPVTSTASQLNTGVLPVGAIIAFNGTTVPTGYALCDGGTYSRSDGTGTIVTPNLRDRFLVSTGSTYTLGQTGGTSTVTPTITIGGTALSVANLPSSPIVTLHDPGHNHGLIDPGHTHGLSTFPYYSVFFSGGVAAGLYALRPDGGTALTLTTTTTGITLQPSSSNVTATSNGTDTPHGHTATSSSVSTISPFYALTYIMRI